MPQAEINIHNVVAEGKFFKMLIQGESSLRTLIRLYRYLCQTEMLLLIAKITLGKPLDYGSKVNIYDLIRLI